ncbi:hypothetical protein COCSADRAFT_169041 [Bipolaris sorokiniana ND90Pr]|uniref:Alcohol dehydrogenase-like N-terminal domain-containing protein n=1 Tax=Cochliobolus sativus (strain ND90Pr / ATCC 201652) TaxID=665912 RepID=M2TGN1_COCSN|nr:uncharacterized protein COCSADRAFT_169041 [Bipolaris sorokiniana ND90Pr]EMD67882.1 hypothetical protein COCSADRAFT_169041 [Bipolaris sorokiniana ND90Pr]
MLDKRMVGVVVNPGPNFSTNIEEVDIPEPGRYEILVKINASGLCCSDIGLMAEEFPVRMSTFNYRTLGYKGAGIIVKLGCNVQNLKLGDRAGIKPIRDICGACELCWGGLENYYRNAIMSGVSATGGGGVEIQCVQIVKAMGFRPVVVNSGPKKQELSLSRVADVVGICDGIGAHSVAVLAAAAYKNAVGYIGSRVRATVMSISLREDCHGTQKDAIEVLNFARRGLLQDMSEVKPLSMLPQSVKDLQAGNVPRRTVIKFNL